LAEAGERFTHPQGKRRDDARAALVADQSTAELQSAAMTSSENRPAKHRKAENLAPRRK